MERRGDEIRKTGGIDMTVTEEKELYSRYESICREHGFNPYIHVELYTGVSTSIKGIIKLHKKLSKDFSKSLGDLLKEFKE
jgi:hypothetical protein